MKVALLIAALASPSLPLPSPSPVPGSVLSQDDEKPDKRPEIKQMVTDLKGHIKKRGAEDLEAIGLIDQLGQMFPDSGPKDRALIVKEVGACLKVKRQEDDDGIRDNKLYMASAVMLGHMGPESAKTIEGWIDHKQHRKDLVLQRELIKSLGKTKVEKSIKTLTDLLKHRHAEIQAAAAEALANFADADQKLRKDMFEETLKILGGAKVNMDSDPNDTVARERYDKIQASFITTLQVLSGADLRDPAKWQSWWNDNKRKNWDEE